MLPTQIVLDQKNKANGNNTASKAMLMSSNLGSLSVHTQGLRETLKTASSSHVNNNFVQTNFSRQILQHHLQQRIRLLQLQRRGLSIQSLFGWKKKQLRSDADAYPVDTDKQAQFLQDLNAKRQYDEVVVRCESGKFALNDSVKKEYITALVNTNNIHKITMADHLPSNSGNPNPNNTNPNSNPNPSPSPTASTPNLFGTSLPNFGSPIGAPPGFGVSTPNFGIPNIGGIPIMALNNPFYGSNGGYSGYNGHAFGGNATTSAPQPIPVQIVKGGSHGYRSLAAVAVLLMVFGAAVAYVLYAPQTSEDKSALHFPVTNAHSLVENVEVKFDDVKGCDDAKEELQEVVEYLKNPNKFTKLGARLPKGVLLVGDPGTGKTLLARAVAGEAGVPFFYCSGSSFDELYVGVGPRRVRNLFEDAKKYAPCIIFIDEIDAVGTSRQRTNSSSYAKESTLNQLLTEMDGFKQNKGIIVIGATNFPDALDSALTRAGRFDKQVVVPAPDLRGRKEILDFYLKQTVPGPDVDSSVVARGTAGFTGADLSNLINIASIKASIQEKAHIDMKDIENAKDDVIMGIQRKRAIETPESRRLTAYHESGHALVSLFMDGCHPLHKATIVQRGRALGVTVSLPENDLTNYSKKQALAHIAMCMGGRIAEELIFGEDEVTSGASNDILQATQMAESMVTKWGLSKLGPVHYRHNFKQEYSVSEEQRKLIDTEVKEIIQQQYTVAENILKTNEAALHRIAGALLEYETLTGEEIKMLADGKSLNKKVFDSNSNNNSTGNSSSSSGSTSDKKIPITVVTVVSSEQQSQ